MGFTNVIIKITITIYYLTFVLSLLITFFFFNCEITEAVNLLQKSYNLEIIHSK